MASTWGSNTWSSNSWGSDNNIISVTGIGATVSLGNETAQANSDVIPTGVPITISSNLNVTFDIGAAPQVSGFGTTFNLGIADAGPDAMVTGLNTAPMSLGTMDAYNLEGWGRQQWNTFAWGITGSLLVTGEEATANVGSIAQVTGNASVIPTGIPITSSLGDESIEISFEIELTGFAVTSNLGIADAGPDAMLTGIGATGSVGNVEAYNLEGWGRYFWGQYEWGATGEWEQVDLTGIALSANLGTVDAAPDAEVTGIGFNASLAVGTVVIGEGNVAVTGEAITASLGTSIGFTSVEVDLTGIALSANLGSVVITANANTGVTGELMTAAEGTVDPSPDATVTGIGFSGALAVGTVIAGSANVTVVGQGFGAGLGLGTLIAESFIDVTGIAMSASVGSPLIKGFANVTLTGFALTSSLNNGNTLIWNQVNTGTAPTWTPVTTRAA